MIIFLNFAPITFMGGAEKWMNETAGRVGKHEKSLLVSVAPEVANVYGKLVLKRTFDARSDSYKLHDNISLAGISFLPFSVEWKRVREQFKKSRLIYAKYELLELLIIIYFGGLGAIKKTVAGIHSPFLYATPGSLLDHVHNAVYRSQTSQLILSHVKKIHVLNVRDKNIMRDDLKLENVTYVPNGIMVPKNPVAQSKEPDKLFILFVGELSERKGVDVLLDIMKHSPKNFFFTIAGDGPMSGEVRRLAAKNNHCTYKGYLHEEWLQELYKANDVLILPSRAESMSLATLEALSHGLIIVNSHETSLSLEKDIEYSCDSNNIAGYIDALKEIQKRKQDKQISRVEIQNYFKKNFSSEIIYKKLFTEVLSISSV